MHIGFIHRNPARLSMSYSVATCAASYSLWMIISKAWFPLSSIPSLELSCWVKHNFCLPLPRDMLDWHDRTSFGTRLSPFSTSLTLKARGQSLQSLTRVERSPVKRLIYDEDVLSEWSSVVVTYRSPAELGAQSVRTCSENYTLPFLMSLDNYQ